MRQFILRTDLNCKTLYAYLKANWQAMAANNTPFVAIIEEYKAKRHNQQNRLYWSYLKQIATQAMIDGKNTVMNVGTSILRASFWAMLTCLMAEKWPNQQQNLT